MSRPQQHSLRQTHSEVYVSAVLMRAITLVTAGDYLITSASSLGSTHGMLRTVIQILVDHQVSLLALCEC